MHSPYLFLSLTLILDQFPLVLDQFPLILDQFPLILDQFPLILDLFPYFNPSPILESSPPYFGAPLYFGKLTPQFGPFSPSFWTLPPTLPQSLGSPMSIFHSHSIIMQLSCLAQMDNFSCQQPLQGRRNRNKICRGETASTGA